MSTILGEVHLESVMVEQSGDDDDDDESGTCERSGGTAEQSDGDVSRDYYRDCKINQLLLFLLLLLSSNGFIAIGFVARIGGRSL